MVNFTFDGKPMQAQPGDTLAAALLRNGVRVVARSFKYHRPRGIMAAGVEEPSALVTVGEGGRAEPNTRATQVFVYEGLVARSQNRWPSLAFDAGAVLGLAAPVFAAGFYYKTFFGPPKRWMFYERFIRRAAGLGPAPAAADPDAFEHRAAFCDVLVVGSGPAGLAAASEAAAAGARVLLVEQTARLAPDQALQGRRVLAFAGIARPSKFHQTLRDAGADVVATADFPDHHRFTAAELDGMLRRAAALGVVPATTPKDAVRLTPDMRAQVLVIGVFLVWDDPAGIEALLDTLQ